MTTAQTSSDHGTSSAGERDQVTQHHSRASKLFDKDHAYAARLVQIATAIRSVMRSTMTMTGPDQIPSEIQEERGITASDVTQSRARGSGGP